VEQILAWADAHHAAHGRWPNKESGPIAGAPGETWCAIGKALAQGRRGLPAGTTLAGLLSARRGCADGGDFALREIRLNGERTGMNQ